MRTSALLLVVVTVLVAAGVSTSSGDDPWPQDGKRICTAPASQDQMTVASNGNGTMAVLWRDGRNNDTNSDIYGQAVETNGRFLWAPGDTGIAICRVANPQGGPTAGLDPQGRVWAAWEDGRCVQGHAYAQGIEANGAPICVDNGFLVSHGECQRQGGHPSLCMLDATSAVVATWKSIAGFPNRSFVHVQKIGATCTGLWGASPIVAYQGGPNDFGEFYPATINDGSGGVIVAFQHNTADNGNGLVMASRVDFSGAVVWSGVGVCTSGGTQGPSLTPPAIVPDGGGGAIIVWTHGAAGSRILRGQRIDPTGTRQWGDCGKIIASGSGDHRQPVLVRSTLGRTFVIWETGPTGNEDVFAQRVNFLGDTLATRIPVCTEQFRQGAPQAVASYEGGCIVAWEDERQLAIGDPGDVYAQQITVDGVILGPANGAAVCSLATRQWSPRLAENGFGGALVAWNDSRNGNTDIYAKMLWRRFPVDANPAPMLRAQLTVAPNPFNPAARIVYTLPDRGPVLLRVFDLRGRLVATLVNDPLPAGEHTATWLGTDRHGRRLPSGIYFARLTMGEKQLTRKLVVAR